MKQQQISFSIIIPTYNRPQQLKTCLQSLANLDYPHNSFEVLVVNDGSQMSLEPLVKPFQAQLNLTLINQTNAGPATARNVGASKAQGEFLAFTDDDSLPSPSWLNVLAQYLTNFANCLVGGKTINALPENIYATASQLLLDYLYLTYSCSPHQSRFVTSNNMAISTQLFQRMGGFNQTFPLAAGEDREFCHRLLNQ
jgi:glycosyltransferase involved in cell wall biosynthesis